MKKIKESTYKKVYYYINIPFLILFGFLLFILFIGDNYIKNRAYQVVTSKATVLSIEIQGKIINNLDKSIFLLEKFKPKVPILKEITNDVLEKARSSKFFGSFVEKDEDNLKNKAKEKIDIAFQKLEQKYDIKFEPRTLEGVEYQLNSIKNEIEHIEITDEMTSSVLLGSNLNFSDNGFVSKSFDKVRVYYKNTLDGLLADIRLVIVFNFIVFLIAVFGGIITKREDDFFYPMVIATVSVVIGSSFYAFNQDWVYNILTHNYVGGTYITILFFILLFDVDILLNKAKVTEAFFRSLPDIIESIDITDIDFDISIDF